MTIRFILASASPARLRILRSAGVDPEVIVSNIDEEELVRNANYTEGTHQQVGALAGSKALEVRDRVSGEALILGCDSMLDFEGESYGKPKTYDEAVQRWKRMRGKSGKLFTGHCLADSPARKIHLAVTYTVVHFADLTDEEIELYCATGEPLNVAGAFTLDELGAWFIDRIEGDAGTVIGVCLPILRQGLSEFGLTLRDIGYPTP